MASAFTSIFYHKGYSGIRYREVYKLIEEEIQLIKTEQGVKRKEMLRLEEETEKGKKDLNETICESIGNVKI